MNKFKSGILISSLTLFFMIIFLMSSCRKEKEVNPDYAGTWVTEQAILTNNAVLQVKDIVTLTKNNYTDIIQLFDESTSKYIDYLKLNGILSVNVTVMYVDITEVGVTSFDMITGKPTGTIQTYKAGTPEFDNVFNQTGQSKTFSFEFDLSGNSLTIYTDNNGDGDYTDANETSVYTRQ